MQKRWAGQLRILVLALSLCFIALPFVAAHERYVLAPDEIARIERITDHANPFESLLVPFQAFMFMTSLLLALGLLLIVNIASRHPHARRVARFLVRADRWGIRILRVVFGASLILAAFYQTLFLPDMVLTGSWGVALAYLQVAIGFFIIFNYATDAFALASVLLFIVAAFMFPSIVGGHLDVLGVALYLLCSHHGQTKWLTGLLDVEGWSKRMFLYLKSNAFEILRMLLGFALIVNGVVYKFFYPEFFLRVVNVFSLQSAWGIDALFLTLMIGMAEVWIGVLLVSGIETKFFAFLAVCFFTFEGILMREGPLGHLLLFAILVMILTHKDRAGERLTLEKKWESWLDL